MNFSESLSYLNSFLNFERLHHTGNFAWNLRRMRILLEWAGHPEKNYPRVVIAGTKGKGSTGFFLESFLESYGVRTGFYSSPHLQDPRERIRIRGRIISREAWAREVSEVRRLLQRRKMPAACGAVTYFEILTLMAALAFKRAGVQVGIFEAGLGGRLDATHALKAGLAIITPIHFDHEAILGNTLAKIAGEKAALIEPGGAVVTGHQPAPALAVITRQARKQKALLYRSNPYPGKLALEGDFQRANAGSAWKALEILKEKHGLVLGKNARKTSFKWPARLELIRKAGGSFLLDGAHNPVSIQALVRNLQKGKKRVPLAVFGVSRDKNSELMLKNLSRYFKEIILVKNPGPRAQAPAILLKQARGLFRLVFTVPDVRDALELAKARAGTNTAVVTGSFYLAGEARGLLNA